ncbi:hypothetical protein [Shewanella sp. ANA-3]|uniref:hypothetical protein n=1 Tax=Shewanella sp. (strain ANA-3) TaxID=94122 RepID=UPI0002E5D5AD|nr:hypothetical protein [Shewanella sp. ANA-3]
MSGFDPDHFRNQQHEIAEKFFAVKYNSENVVSVWEGFCSHWADHSAQRVNLLFARPLHEATSAVLDANRQCNELQQKIAMLFFQMQMAIGKASHIRSIQEQEVDQSLVQFSTLEEELKRGKRLIFESEGLAKKADSIAQKTGNGVKLLKS